MQQHSLLERNHRHLFSLMHMYKMTLHCSLVRWGPLTSCRQGDVRRSDMYSSRLEQWKFCVTPCPPATVSMKVSQWDGKTIWITVAWLDWDTIWMALLQGGARFDSKLDLFLLLNLCFPLLLFTKRTLFINNGLPQGTLLLCLDVKPKRFCSGPCPPVDGCRNEEMNTSSPQV